MTTLDLSAERTSIRLFRTEGSSVDIPSLIRNWQISRTDILQQVLRFAEVAESNKVETDK